MVYWKLYKIAYTRYKKLKILFQIDVLEVLNLVHTLDKYLLSLEKI
jgi:hypothetical protein